MQFQTAILVALFTSALALPTQPSKRDLVTLDVDPSVDVDLLNDLCVGIAVCNPVTVNSNNDDSSDSSRTIQ
ncbi:hypothetical protein N431DRAFT_464210 [Stipitochalara longipes BDJ]|nr:hypothetical protein N431DRAFT_464210 [Stipitochalara longipes BDJ]